MAEHSISNYTLPPDTAVPESTASLSITADQKPSANTFATLGFIDLYTRLCEPGLKRRGNIQHETGLAKQAGFKRLVCSPDTQPCIDSTATVEQILSIAKAQAACKLHPMGALTADLAGVKLTELTTLHAAGCVTFGQADQPINDSAVLLRAMEYAATFNIPLSLTALDVALAGNGCVHDGPIASQYGLPAIPALAETAGLTRLLELANASGCRIHISRISCARSVQMIRDTKRSGLNITCDVGIHHLFFTDEQISGYDARFHSAVPFRGQADRDALRQGVADGVIDAICSDHAPLDSDARLAPLPATAPGLACYPQFLPLFLALPKLLGTELETLLPTVTTAPARVLGLTYDFEDVNSYIVIDPDVPVTVSDAPHHNPFTGINNVKVLTGEDAPLMGVVLNHTSA